MRSDSKFMNMHKLWYITELSSTNGCRKKVIQKSVNVFDECISQSKANLMICHSKPDMRNYLEKLVKTKS